MVPSPVFAALVLSFLLIVLPVPVLFVLLWRKRGFPLNSFITGSAVFLFFYMVLRYYAVNYLGGPSHPLALFVSALAVEGGRLIGFKLLPRKEGQDLSRLKVGLSQALGYITAVFLLINAFETAMNFVYAGALQGWGALADYLNRFPAESVDRVQVLILETPPSRYLLRTLSLYLALPVQLVLTLFVFEGFRRKELRVSLAFLASAVVADYLYFQLSQFAEPLGQTGRLLYLSLFCAIALIGLGRFWKEELGDTLRSA